MKPTGVADAVPSRDGNGTEYRPSAHRRVKLDGRPSFSVVMAARQSVPRLVAQLGRLSEPCALLSAELVVAGTLDDAVLAVLRAEHPDVRFIPCPPGTSLFGLREAGLASAEGDIVTIIDEEDEPADRLAHLASLLVVDDGIDADVEAMDGRPTVRRVDQLKAGDHVVIIGAGPGGLTAAYTLARKGVRVTVLEGSDVVGGISQTAQYNGYRFDIGGHRFFTKIKPVEDLWHEILGNEFISVPRLSRIHYDGKFFDYPLKAGNALRGLGLWNACSMVLSYVWAHLRPSPVEENLEEWVTNRFGKKLYQIFFKT
ncbi:MAG: FAD-dependent oxidoreductase [Longimicrobiales bacterium]